MKLPRGITRLIGRVLLASALAIASSHAVGGEAVLHEDFEGAEPSWRILAGDASHRVDELQRVRDPVHSGAWSETLALSALDGTYIHFGHELGAAQIINELRVSLFVLADRPGLQLIVRAVLPRSIDPKTGRPLTLPLYGPLYDRAGQWQELVLDQIPQQLQRHARIAQAGQPRTFDLREAYIDAVMLNVYGGRGATRVWIDDMAVSGFVGRERVATADAPAVRPASFEEEPPRRAVPEVTLHAGVLAVGGRPTFPRIVDYRGEPLLLLKQLGFNGVKLSTPPSGNLLAEAAENRMWLICPPPAQFGGTVGREFDPVMAWDLGQSLTHQELPAADSTVRQLRTADRETRRPIVGDALNELRAYSELVDIMIMGRRTLGTSLELSDYATWQQQRARLLRPGTSYWWRIPTQPDEAWLQQLAALAPGIPISTEVSSRQLRQLVFTALAGGARGLMFESRVSLAGADAATRRRASVLKLLNLELSLVENWVAAGSFVTPAVANDPAMAATVLQTDRARLLLPLRFARGDQFVVDEGRGGDVSFVVPGVPESNDAFELTPAGLRPLLHKRVTGGMSVTLRDAPPAAMIVLTQDPLVIDSLSRVAATERHAIAELSREMAIDELTLGENVDRGMSAVSLPAPNGAQLLAAARQQVKRCDAAFQSGDYPLTIQASRDALRPLEQLRRLHWDRMSQRVSSPMFVALAADFATLPYCVRFIENLRYATLGENLLPAGDFEDLEMLRRVGWKHFQLPQKKLGTEVDLSATGPHSGASCLHLSAAPQAREAPPAYVESSPVWITSAPVPVEAGTLLQIHGWVRVPHPIVGSVDGLLIADSLGGEALAERVGQTRGWQEFTFFRAAPAAGTLTITFAMTGIGEAFLDDVTVRRVSPPQSGPGDQSAHWAPAYLPTAVR